MADFTPNMSGTVELDNSLIKAYSDMVLFENGQAQILEGLVDVKVDIGAKTIGMTKYTDLPLATTPLVERERSPGMKMADSEVTLTPIEYGDHITLTSLASLQSGGKVDMAAVRLLATNLARTQDALIVQALMTAPAGNKEASAVSGAQLDGQYVKLASASVPMFGDEYVAVMNEAQIAVLRAESGWYDVKKYENATSVLKNEVGLYKGHRIVRHQGIAANHAISLGAGALGKAVSKPVGIIAKAPVDEMNRFPTLAWYGVFCYGLIDTTAVQILTGV